MAETVAWPAGGGETGALIRSPDGSRTPLGGVATWPQSLRTAVGIMLSSPGPALVMWGPRHVQLYNDAYAQVLGARHPAMFGVPALEAWSDARGFLAPILDGIDNGGPPVVVDEQPLSLLAGVDGARERAFRASFWAIANEQGAVGGIYHVLHETTAAVHAVEALRESEERLRLSLHAADLGIWENDIAADRFRLDPRAQELYALPGEVETARLVERVHPDDHARLAGEWTAAMDPAVRGPVQTSPRA